MKANIPQMSIKYSKGEPIALDTSCTEKAAEVLKGLYDMDTIQYKEEAISLYLDNHNNAIGWSLIGSGSQTMVMFDLRIVFATALSAGATKIILSHNHPSGILKASDNDISTTRNAMEVGKFLGIQVIDHIIITKDSYYSVLEDM